MSISRPPNSDKTEMSGSTIGFRFHANEEQLEEVQSKEDNPDVKEENAYLKLMTDFLKPEVLDGGKILIVNKNTIADGLKEQRNFLGKRSLSVDSPTESPLPNAVERWKKFSDFREKITKTVEGKISEMKIDRNVLGKTKLIHSKENSSISDSEDTSESSKVSEHCKDIENYILMPEKTIVQNSKTIPNTLDSSLSDIKKETDFNEGDNELRNRKAFPNFPELLNIPDIKIAVAKKDTEPSSFQENLDETVESGVEAEESLSKQESDSVALLDGSLTEGRDSNNPPFDDTFGGALVSVILSQTNTAVFLLLFFLYVFIPLPEFFKGCLLSFLLVLFWGTVKEFMHCEETFDHQVSCSTLHYASVSNLRAPKTEIPKGVWFNEYEQETYDPDYYSVTNTVPVYLELSGNILKVSRAKGKIRRRATYDEPEYKLPIISERTFNLKGCYVHLLPEGLTRKRLYSKKYPIVILLKRDSLLLEKRNGKEIEDKEFSECFESDIQVSTTTISPKNKCTLFLFARCDRQKEEWYRRLLTATRVSIPDVREMTPRVTETSESESDKVKTEEEKTWGDDNHFKESTSPLENLSFTEGVVLDEYLHYMAAFANFKTQEEPKEFGEEFGSMQAQLQWFNAFVNRILFDVFRSPYWLTKIQEKIQRKINSIRMPYYIEDIEVIEMDLGKTGPIFHRVTSPYMDDRGLWFDMDLTFNGLVRITIQTHLNLVKLQKGAEEIEASGSVGTAAPPPTVSSGSTSAPSPAPAPPPAPEKVKKGKKSEKTEKESKTNINNKESTEMPLKLSSQHTSSEVVGRKGKAIPEIEAKTTDDYTEKLIDEVSQLAEIAVEEVISKTKEHEAKGCPPCPCLDGVKPRSAIYDSELEDSAESSSEDEEEAEENINNIVTIEEPRTMGKRYPRNRRSSKKIFKVFENVAQSKYFRTMAQSKYIQKAIAGVSAAKLRLTIEIKSCTGVLAVNIPPPPTDRFWYGFRKMPTLIFSANPKIGDKAVRFIHIRNYLQKRILYELKAKAVLPNMLNGVFPILIREGPTSEYD